MIQDEGQSFLHIRDIFKREFSFIENEFIITPLNVTDAKIRRGHAEDNPGVYLFGSSLLQVGSLNSSLPPMR